MKTTPAPTRTLIVLLAVVTLLAGACSSESSESVDTSVATAVVPVETTAAPAVDPGPEPSGGGGAPSVDSGTAPTTDDGWIEGEPDWGGDAAAASVELEAMAEAVMEEVAMAADAAEMAGAEAAAPEPTAAPATTAAAAATIATEDDVVVSEADAVVHESELRQVRLTGGSIDDNERFEDYLAYRADFFRLGIQVRDLDPAGRIVVTVTGEGGLPAAGAEVLVTAGQRGVGLRTTADGTVRFHPEAYELGDGPFTVRAGSASTTAERGESVALETSLPTAAGETVALDVLFLLDATGSMEDEIHQLKITIDEVAHRIHRLPGDVDVRLGMTIYRDEGDEFLNRTFDFTPDIQAFSEALSMVVAADGGDNPEALDEALAAALSQPSWRSAADTVQLVFLVADAPPQVLRQVPVPYTASMRNAAQRGIKIFPVSSSGTNDQAEFVFRQLAQFTGARYVFLTYGAAGRATGASTDIDQRDYEELSLDDLIVRLVAEELADLLGPTDAETPEPSEEGQQDN
ncbi:MAG: VWA domain-containing protein [Acidimicrobiia bacterium]|nr:VWA domain-containing protein [Acidimicrobiia bacterium]